MNQSHRLREFNVYKIVCLSRIPYDRYAGTAHSVEAALLECSTDAADDDSAGSTLDILDVDFFDDEMIVLVYRIQGTQGRRRGHRTAPHHSPPLPL